MYKIDSYNGLTRILGVSKTELDLDKTFNCGQAFRWDKLKSGEWCGVIGNSIVILGQKLFDDNNYCLYTNLAIGDIKQLIYYLNLDMNYTLEVSKICLTEFEKQAYIKGRGIHILRQDLLETMITFLMSTANTMNNIRNIVNKLCRNFGSRLELRWNNELIVRYSFPTIEQLSKITYSDAREMSMGMRASYFISMIEEIINDPSILQCIASSDYYGAMNFLKGFAGIGDKVANCICLFSLHHVNAFPIDTHIKQIINTHYNGYIDIKRFNGIAGIIQQYIFYYKAFH